MPTALELTPEQLQKYIDAARRRKLPELTPEQIAEREALIERARQAAQMLKEKCGATRVVLFGSLAHQAWFTRDSDVDMMAEGLGTDYFRAWGDVEKIIDDRQVDLIDWDMASESLRKTIEEEGVEL